MGWARQLPRLHQHLCNSIPTPINQFCVRKSLAIMQTVMASQLGSTLKLGGTRINRPASSCPASRVSGPIQAIFTRNKDKAGKVQAIWVDSGNLRVINHQLLFWPAHAEVS